MRRETEIGYISFLNIIPHGVDTIDDPMTTRTRVIMVLACSRLMALKFLIVREVGALIDLIFRPRH